MPCFYNNFVGGSDTMQKISDFYYENIYNIFVKYCNSNNMYYMSDLDKFDFSKLQSVKGIGVSKIEAIKEKYNGYIKNNLSCDVFSKVHKDNYSLPVQILSLYGISKNIVTLLINAHIFNVENLIICGSSGIYKLKSNVYSKIVSALEYLSIPLIKRLNELVDEFKNSEHYDIILKRSKGVTLNKIGEELSVTRERIRQIESAELLKLKYILGIVLNDIVNKYNYKSCINLNKLEIYFKDYDILNLMKYALSCIYKDFYLEFCNKLLINGDTKEKVLDKLNGITHYYIKDIVNFTKKIVVITESLNKNDIPYIDVEDLTNYLLLNGYVKKGNYIFKSGISYGLICSLVVKTHFKEGIRIHDDYDIERLRKIIKKEFGDISLPDNNRALGTRISSFLVLCDRGCYTVTSNIKIPDYLISKIRNYIEKTDESTLFFNDIFIRFKDELLNHSNIKNRYFLQGVLKYFYEDEFVFERDSITKQGRRKKNMRELILEFLKETGRPVHRREIKEKFPGATDVVITNAQLSTEDILQWEYNYYIHSKNLSITREDEENILNCLNTLFDKYKGYTSEQLLYDLMFKKDKELLYKNHIKNASNMFYLASYLFKDKFMFRRPHILKDSSLRRDLSSRIIVEKFLLDEGRLKYTDYQQFVSMMKWSMGTTYAVFKDLEKELLRISENEYIVKEKFNINKESLDEIIKVLNDELEKNEFISISKFKDFIKLPDIDFKWNSFLLASIVDKYLSADLKIIVPTVEDRRYVKEIIVRPDFDSDTYEEFIIAIIKKYALNGSTLYHLESRLSSLGLIGRYLPKELYNSKYIYVENDRFYTV